MAVSVLRLGLLSCSVYFTLTSLAHWTGFKVPLLFIYYDVPSLAYQDKIIGCCTASFAAFMFHGAYNPEAAPVALLSLLLAVAGMAGINASADLRTVIGPGAPTAAYWGQTAAIAVLVAVLWFLWYEEERTAMGRRVARKRK